jgi:cystathionine gamma-synthase
MIEGAFEEQAQLIEGLLGINPHDRDDRFMLTNLVHGYGTREHAAGDVSTPLHMSSTFAHPSFDGSTGYMYSRCGNPTRLELENTIALLEGGRKAWAFSSGMSAIAALLKLFRTGDHLLVSDDLYGGTYRLFSDIYTRYGMEFDYVDFTDLDEVESSIRPNTRAFFVETPTNPTMKVVDLAATSELAHSKGLVFVVDNTLMTPYFQKPFYFGADIIIHSGTKYLCGHNDVTAGFLVVHDETFLEDFFTITMSEGALLSPADSWLMLRSLKTLGIRLDRQQDNALQIAEFLKGHAHVQDVFYVGDPDHPSYKLSCSQTSGFGAMISFHVDSPNRVNPALERLNVISYAESLGGVESLMTFPLMQTHGAMAPELREKLVIDERLLRLAVGIEDVRDLIADLDQALE